MHEFGSVQEAVRKIRAIQPLPRKVRIRIGKMRGSAKAFEDMFRERTRDTELAGIGLDVEGIPVEIKCSCGLEGPVRIMDHLHWVRCPVCGEIADVKQGNELEVEAVR